ncbi:hypothetical protein O0L34_g19365 [Tuta absoluta]|nr:hypothetical protein O0L34_g19365 [Tuta absoluta]
MESIRECAGCKRKIETRHYLTCAICDQNYDLECANVGEKRFFNVMDAERKAKWVCPECLYSMPKTDNVNTPVGVKLQPLPIRVEDRRKEESSNVKRPIVVPVLDISGCSEQERNINLTRGNYGTMHPDQSLEHSILRETCSSGNLRKIIREELERAIENDLCQRIAKKIVAQIDTSLEPIKKALAEIDSRMVILENRFKTLEMEEVIYSEPVPVPAEKHQQHQKRKPSQSLASGSGTQSNKANSTKTTQKKVEESSLPQLPLPPRKTNEASRINFSKPLPVQPSEQKNIVTESGSKQQVTKTASDGKNNTEEKTEDTEWKMVANRKKGKKSERTEVKKGGNDKIESLKAVYLEKTKYLHVWSLHLDTSVDIVSQHVKSLCQKDSSVTVDQIHPKVKRDYSSFKIGVSESNYDKIAREDAWPVNTRFSEWVQFWSFRSQARAP